MSTPVRGREGSNDAACGNVSTLQLRYVTNVVVSRVRGGEPAERRHRRHGLRAARGGRLRQVRTLAGALLGH